MNIAPQKQQLVNINTSFEDGDWWIRNKRTNERRRCDALNNKNKRRMYVDGKYVPQTHLLWKSGRYNSFNDAAFSSFTNYTSSTKGDVYIITNKAWPEWVKIGKAVDATDRLKSYQTSDPFRAYELHHSVTKENRHTAEVESHKALEVLSKDRKNEWFKVDLETAVSCIEGNV
jgi:hypothetical protein|tara:strand:- start:41 stop:559 length:519 start_codon:yes stop_codon:yes gene_type:complete